MQPTYRYISGQPAAVVASIARSIGQYERHYSQVKVGITSNPERRANEHAQSGWQRMVIKYKTSSRRNANLIEQHFIVTRPELKNKWAGNSQMTPSGPYYVYILLK